MVSIKEKLLFLKEIGVEYIERKEDIEEKKVVKREVFERKGAEKLNNEPMPLSKTQLLEKVKKSVFSCKKCPLYETKRNYVFGEGNIDAEIMFVGEAPGEDEDIQGRPFVGRAGQLLTKMIKAMGYERREVYIANILKCRPPGNKTPDKKLRMTCFPHLQKQIAIIKPKVIVALGKVSAHTLLDTDTPITRLRGNWGEYQGIPVMSTYHPAYILRNYTERVRREAWEDLKKVLKYLEKSR